MAPSEVPRFYFLVSTTAVMHIPPSPTVCTWCIVVLILCLLLSVCSELALLPMSCLPLSVQSTEEDVAGKSTGCGNWKLESRLLFLQQCNPNMNLTKLKVEHIPMWVRFSSTL